MAEKDPVDFEDTISHLKKTPIPTYLSIGFLITAVLICCGIYNSQKTKIDELEINNKECQEKYSHCHSLLMTKDSDIGRLNRELEQNLPIQLCIDHIMSLMPDQDRSEILNCLNPKK